MAEKFVPVKLNAEDRQSRVQIGEHNLTYAEAVAAYGVQGCPSTLFLEPNGQLLFKFSGYRPKDQYLEVLKYFGERKFEEEAKE